MPASQFPANDGGPDWVLAVVDANHADVTQGELELRFRVLREPLGHTRDAVAFPFDNDSIHLLAYDTLHQVIGCVLFHPESEIQGRLYQMAVDPKLQGKGLGRALVERLEDELQARGFRRITLHAREVAAGFYGRLGYEVEGTPFEEVGLAHFHMAKEIGGS